MGILNLLDKLMNIKNMVDIMNENLKIYAKNQEFLIGELQQLNGKTELVSVLNPKTLHDAYCLAKCQEAANNIMKKSSNTPLSCSSEFDNLKEVEKECIELVCYEDCCKENVIVEDGSVKYTMTSMSDPEPVVSLAVLPVSKDSEKQISKALSHYQKEDPTFRVKLAKESGRGFKVPDKVLVPDKIEGSDG
ncbi:mitochondrial translation elongation factor G [Artemisia annua]|uniref:Mitochondrial translation elongation factor G n=1 Tax=Artemisia annua TaxID=35608 RepID=A0A2U1KUZ4_ARTAN|nr:mitochondrial translation elongation factor G [Artemisia annua]